MLKKLPRASPGKRLCAQLDSHQRQAEVRSFLLLDSKPSRYHSSMPDQVSTEAERVRLELLRKMTPQQKARLVSELTLAVQQLAFAGIRQTDPAASDDEIWLRLSARRLGRDTVRNMYGFDPEAK